MISIRRGIIAAVTATAFAIAGAAGLASAQAAPASAEIVTKHRLPSVAVKWAAAWNGSDAQKFAGLYVKQGSRYTDHAFGATYTDRAGIATWFGNTKAFLQSGEVKVTGAFADCDMVSISWTFSGHVAGAPKPFTVPAVTVLQLRNNEIVTNDDYYNLRDLLVQSGLPADMVLG
ncbi:nuclear transport factor 2 family protein [Lentzea sp.]|uniref:nuclear transport factor 2 family protein n=1 Tax=Lentzea sp. TaxID=56099 RepID=UPI002ED4D562